MSWACLPCVDICFVSTVPFVVRIPIPPRPKIDNNIDSDSQLFIFFFPHHEPGRVAQSAARLTQEPEVPGPIPGPVSYFRFSFR